LAQVSVPPSMFASGAGLRHGAMHAGTCKLALRSRHLLLTALALVLAGPDAEAALLRGGSRTGAGLREAAGGFARQLPDEMQPETFLNSIDQIPTDLLILFYDDNCPDCARLAPQWLQVTTALRGRPDLTAITMADPQGLAPGRYHHEENPAIFFAPRDRKHEPIMFPVSEVHAFTDTEETAATDTTIRSTILQFTAEHLSSTGNSTTRGGASMQHELHAGSGAALPGAATLVAAKGVAAGPPTLGQLNAKLLVVLRSYEKAETSRQVEILRSAAFARLPLAQFLLSVAHGPLHEPLAVLGARYLDQQSGKLLP